LLCYRASCTSIDLANAWASRYYDSRNDADLCRVLVERVRSWVSLYPSDFTQALIDRFREIWMFVVERPMQFKEDLYLKEALQSPISSRKSSSEGRRATDSDSATSPVTVLDLQPQGKPTHQWCALKPDRLLSFFLSRTDVARVMTIDEFELFAEVPIIEFVAKGGWAKGEKTPSLDRLTERFNKISRWVTTTVVCADDGQKMDTLLKVSRSA
jgi:hypothetical protein